MQATLLLVETNRHTAEQTRKNLSAIKPGWKFITANSHAQARSMMERSRPDAAVMEADPDGHTLRLMLELAAMRPDVKLFVSGAVVTDEFRSGVNHDGRGYTFLEKPYSLGGLVKKIEQSAAERECTALCLRPKSTALAVRGPNPMVRAVEREVRMELPAEMVEHAA